MKITTSFFTAVLLFFVSSYMVQGQGAANYNNDWIDFDKSYLKFKVAWNSVYRIPYEAIVDQGIVVEGNGLMLEAKGREVPIYVTTDGLFGPGDYIEFFGNRNDGELDMQLFDNPDYQLHTYNSLFSDSITYFLSYDLAGERLRYSNLENNLEDVPVKDTHFMYESVEALRQVFTAGEPFRQLAGVNNYLSDFGNGEGFLSSEVTEGDNKDFSIVTRSIYSGPDAPSTVEVETKIVGRSDDPSGIPDHRIQISMGGEVQVDDIFEGHTVHVHNFEVPISYLESPFTPVNYAALQIEDLADKHSVSYIKIEYPHSFDFSGLYNYTFELDNERKYIEVTNFNGGLSPVLLDLSNNLRLFPTVDNSGPETIYKFLLEELGGAGNKRKLHLANTTSGVSLRSIDQVEQFNFVDYTKEENKGTYLILTHPRLFGGEVNQVERYAEYRSSEAGGEFDPLIVNINQLYDQFSWGIPKHPLAIKRFIDFIFDSWDVDPQYLLLLGKSIEYNKVTNAPSQYAESLIPSWGHRSSDTEFSTSSLSDYRPRLGTGRIPARYPEQVKAYLEKVMEYEAYLPCTKEDRLWKKDAIHIAGGGNISEANAFLAFLNKYKELYSEVSMAGNVLFTYTKASDEVIETPDLDGFINDGIGLITFVGHSSGQYWDVDLGPPEDYTNDNGRYPLILTSSCFVGNVHHPVSISPSMAEDYVLAANRGAIGFLAPVSFGFPDYMDIYLSELYNQFCTLNYNEPFGDCLRNTITNIEAEYTGEDEVKLTAQEYAFVGDPAIRVNSFDKPELIIEETDIYFEPSAAAITANLDSFAVNVIVTNIGMAVPDSFNIRVNRTFPDGTVETLSRKFVSPALVDTFTLFIQTGDPSEVAGENFIDVIVDSENALIEDCEDNNSILNLETFIFSDVLAPIFPCNYSIVSDPDLVLKSSTGQPFLTSLPYRIEIDTTTNFDNPLDVIVLNSESGVIEWSPSITYENNEVYYWRASQIPPDDGAYNWQVSSFTFIEDSGPGWNQSDYGQFKNDVFNQIELDSISRLFEYSGINNIVTARNNYYSYAGIQVDLNVSINLVEQSCLKNLCNGGITFLAFKPALTLEPISSFQTTPEEVTGCSALGTYGNIQCGTGEKFGIEFYTGDETQIQNMLNFLNNDIPNGYYVLAYSVKNHKLGGENTAAPIYEYQDEVFDFFADLGAPEISNINPETPFIVFGRKGTSSYQAQVAMPEASLDGFFLDINVEGKSKYGTIETPLIGPSLSWSDLSWSFNSLEDLSFSTDSISIDVYGVKENGTEDWLLNTGDELYHDLANISAEEYPFIRLKALTSDTTSFTVPQLKNWTVHYEQAIELAIDKQHYWEFQSDTLQEGELVQLDFGLTNASSTDADSVFVQFTIIGEDNVESVLDYGLQPTIPAGESIIAHFEYSTEDFPGSNTLVVEVNPSTNSEFSQLEKFKFNNLVTVPFFVDKDKINPVIDVTFDGRHILDGELIAATPEIFVRVNDENPYLALNDTSDFDLFIYYPDAIGEPTIEDEIFFSDSNLEFIPAVLADSESGENVASIRYNPTFTADGNYMLVVRAKDRSDNRFAGQDLYQIRFKVITTPMISNLVNYPNPFSTSTRFVFTLTGTKIPEVLKIQVMTIGGKVVREITKAELGEIYIGNNVTEFAWDGTDQYGNDLANGLYLYRFVSRLDGQDMDHYNLESLDKVFKKELGKMYLMR